MTGLRKVTEPPFPHSTVTDCHFSVAVCRTDNFFEDFSAFCSAAPAKNVIERAAAIIEVTVDKHFAVFIICSLVLRGEQSPPLLVSISR
jgi:hypothetical protein